MNCNECIKANNIATCPNTIYIPDVNGTIDGEYTVIITNLSTGRADNIQVTAVGNTLLVPVSEIGFMMAQTYEIRVYEGEDFNEPREITIGVTSGCCVTFQVESKGTTGTYEILNLNSCE